VTTLVLSPLETVLLVKYFVHNLSHLKTTFAKLTIILKHAFYIAVFILVSWLIYFCTKIERLKTVYYFLYFEATQLKTKNALKILKRPGFISNFAAHFRRLIRHFSKFFFSRFGPKKQGWNEGNKQLWKG